MAQSKDNIITHGLSGKVGNILVFSQRNGKTYVSKVPKQSTKEPTAGQVAHQQKFQLAIIYGKSAIANPATKAEYEAEAEIDESAFNVAVADMLQAPEIDSIDLSGYTGKVGEKIVIIATDDFKVTSVTVNISNADGTLVEEGAAVLGNSGVDWVYTTTAVNASLAGDKITVEASDLPGNVSDKQVAL
jgi:hypothetical protein